MDALGTPGDGAVDGEEAFVEDGFFTQAAGGDADLDGDIGFVRDCSGGLEVEGGEGGLGDGHDSNRLLLLRGEEDFLRKIYVLSVVL